MRNNIKSNAIIVVSFLLIRSACAAFIPLGDDDTPFTYNDIPFEYDGIELDVYKTSYGFVPTESIDLSGYITEKIHIIETASWATNVPDGVVVGHIKIYYIDGSSDTLDLVMGVNIAEWAYDRPENQPYLNHSKVPPAYSYWTNIDSDYYYWGHCFYVQITTQQKTLDNLELILNPTSYTGQPDTGYAPPDWFGITISAITLEVSDGPVVDDDLDIDLLGISATKQFRDGVPQGDLPWSLDITVRMADPDNLHHIEVTKPEASDPFVTLYEEAGSPGLWGCSLDDDYATLTALHDVYKEGPYKVEFCTIDNVVIRSIDIDYDDLPGEPDEPVEFTYPTTNGQTGISINPTFTWSVSPDAGDALMTVIDNDEIVYFDAPVPTSSTSWTPGDLLADHQYELDVFVINIKDWAGGPGFPTMTDSTGDTFSYAHTIEYLNEIKFTTQSSNDPIEEIEEILDFVDESVEDGTLTGKGPGKSADNRLNALINKLEEAQRLIEAGSLEEACDQLWSTYKKCDGQLRPPDFVTGGAAEDLADMILLLMNELGC